MRSRKLSRHSSLVSLKCTEYSENLLCGIIQWNALRKVLRGLWRITFYRLDCGAIAKFPIENFDHFAVEYYITLIEWLQFKLIHSLLAAYEWNGKLWIYVSRIIIMANWQAISMFIGLWNMKRMQAKSRFNRLEWFSPIQNKQLKQQQQQR